MVDIPVLLKRNSSAGAAPGTGDLQLGELAVNTYDGKLFLKKNDGSDAIVEVGLLENDPSPSLAAALDANSLQINGLAAPSIGTDAANKAYVDSVASGLDVKASVRCLASSNIDLGTASDPGAQDGVTLADGDRILLNGQTDASENGIYNAVDADDPTTWIRSEDADSDAEVTAGMFTFIEEGTANGDAGWVLVTNDPIVVGTTELSFSQFSGAGSVSLGSLSDVDLTGVADGDLIQYDSGTWVVLSAIDGGSY